MAQKLQIDNIVGISLAVVLKVARRKWTFGPNPHGAIKVGSSGPPLCFVAHDPKLPSIEWMGVKIPEPIPPEYHDARPLRETFMSLRKEDEFLEFLDRVGAFSQLDESERERGWGLSDLVDFQSALRGLTVNPPAKWESFWHKFSSMSNIGSGVLGAFGFAGEHNLRFHWKDSRQSAWRGSKSVAVIEEGNALSAFLATIEIDHLRGAKFGVCARPDCRMVYEITTKHKRKYCDHDCAHLESVRRGRKKQRRKVKRSGSSGGKLSDGK